MNDPALDGTSVPNATTTAIRFRFLYVGGAGDVVLKTKAGKTVTFSGVPAGQYVWMEGSSIQNTTTATNILACN